MPIFINISAISGNYLSIAVDHDKLFFKKKFFILIGIFYPSGEPISPHRIRCSLFAVVDYVITSDRRERGDLIVPRQKHEIAASLRSSQRRLQQPRLVNNPGLIMILEIRKKRVF